LGLLNRLKREDVLDFFTGVAIAGDGAASRLLDPRSKGIRYCALVSGRGDGAYGDGLVDVLSMILFLSGEGAAWLPLGLSCRSMLVSVSKAEKIDWTGLTLRRFAEVR
jgi:hypothetical protein